MSDADDVAMRIIIEELHIELASERKLRVSAEEERERLRTQLLTVAVLAQGGDGGTVLQNTVERVIEEQKGKCPEFWEKAKAGARCAEKALWACGFPPKDSIVERVVGEQTVAELTVERDTLKEQTTFLTECREAQAVVLGELLEIAGIEIKGTNDAGIWGLIPWALTLQRTAVGKEKVDGAFKSSIGVAGVEEKLRKARDPVERAAWGSLLKRMMRDVDGVAARQAKAHPSSITDTMGLTC